jgi:hypothetical protein
MFMSESLESTDTDTGPFIESLATQFPKSTDTAIVS